MSTFQIDFGASKSKIVGIDLGTTNSLVAVMELTGPRILSGIVPSVVSVTESGEVIAGAEARDALLTHPERTVYSITETGREELLDWLWELTSEPATDYPAFAAPLMFIYALGKDRAIAALSQRAARIEAEISSSDAFRRAFAAEVLDFPRIFGIEEEYGQAMRKAELAWVRATVAELRDGTFPWPDPGDLPEYPARGA